MPTPKKPASRKSNSSKFSYSSAGPYSTIEENGSVSHNMTTLSRVQSARKAKMAARGDPMSKTASVFSGGELGPINEADSNNIGYYSFQFPVDQMEMPASRAEELEFFRLAYTRDPIVARAIDLHTELPLSKMKIEKPKSSVESFSDFVYDWFQRLVNDTRLFNVIIQATREYQIIGESFMFVEQPENYGELTVCKAAAEAMKKGRGFQAGTSPMTEAAHGGGSGDEGNILPDFVEARRNKRSSLKKEAEEEAPPTAASIFIQKSWDKKEAAFTRNIESLQTEFASAGVPWGGDGKTTHKKILRGKNKLAKLARQQDINKEAVRIATVLLLTEAGLKSAPPEVVLHIANEKIAKAASLKTAGPGDAPPPPPAGGAPMDSPAAETAPPPEGGAGDLGGDLGGDPGAMPMDDGMGGGMGGPPMGGGGFGGAPPMDPGQAESAQGAVAVADDAKRAREINELTRYVHLLERKKKLLERLQDMLEERKLEEEIFKHVVNEDFEGFDKIQILQPERISVDNESGDGPEITYKPASTEKASYMNDPDLAKEIKDSLESDGVIALNQNPYKGSYVLHFARKKSGYELHGRSVLQSVMRAVIYREKLRQVQTTLASRNMTPKTLITAPGVSETDVAQLRAHADEMKSDPDYTCVTNYEVNWNEIDASSRLLQLDGEWAHTNSNLAIGLGFSPEILCGEGMYSGNKIALDLMANTYTQFREELSDIIENQIFKPIAILKGFYEMDDYGRPRWIYPKVSFGHMALRDSNDLYECLYNLYSKGSLPVDPLLELLGLDVETTTRQLEDAMYTVTDPKFSDLMGSIYAAVGGEFAQKTNILQRLRDNMHLEEEEAPTGGLEGSGEGL